MRYFFIFSFFLFSFKQSSSQNKPVDFVNPFIGTGGHGHTYPGATLPHGMVQLSPDTRLDGWDGCSGYHYSDSFIYGFSHTHLSGTGCSDYGDILLMPMTGKPSPNNKEYGASFSHLNENASPGYYSVQLKDDNIFAELTCTNRVGFHQYHFPGNTNNHIILDLKHRDEVLESSIQIINSHTVAGFRRSKAWANNQYVYFVLTFSEPFVNKGIWLNDELQPDDIANIEQHKNIKAFFSFNKKNVSTKVAISSVSIEGAFLNMKKELPGWDFDLVKKNASLAWNKELSKIIVKSNQQDQLQIFYTALYHTMVVPNINMDVDGKYRGRDNQIHKAVGFTNYSVFSLWDTYRAAHPLYTIIDQARTRDYILSFLQQYKEGGRLPVWELSSCETDCMIGYHSVSVIVDAYMKGIRSFDHALALEAMKKSANWEHLGLPALLKNGVIEVEDESESVSKGLEYAYNDWCIATYAKAIGNYNDYSNFIARSQHYKNWLDPKTGFMRPRKNGDWLSPFEPSEVNNHFTEANSWQYSFYAPHDMNGYLSLLGGKKNLETKLDALFQADTKTSGRDQADITGMIGQYAHGNEPSHHIAYLYNFAGKPFKTQEKVHQIMKEMYHNAPDGLIGNEDCGQMSAWYVFSALGFYPVTPGTTDYIIGTPLFKEAVIHLENKKRFTIHAPLTSDKNFYVESMIMNSKKYYKSFLSHFDILNGGKLQFNQTNHPTSFGEKDVPVTTVENNLIVLNPMIHADSVSFKSSQKINIYTSQPNAKIFYTTDGSQPNTASAEFRDPIIIDSSVTIKAIAVIESNKQSFVTTAHFHKIRHNWTTSINTAFEPAYNPGGAAGLTDGIQGSIDWRKGNWMGFQKNDAVIMIDLNENKSIHSVSTNFLQDTRSWIIMPRRIEILVSKNGTDYSTVFVGENFVPVNDLQVQLKNVVAIFPTTNSRYIQVKAFQFGKMPAWHEGAGGDSHIFIDEIKIE